MNTEVAIILTVGGIVGAIITTQLWQMNWFKRENFKIQKTNIQAENRIKMKKLEKELGLKSGSVNSPPETKGLLESLSGLDLDKIQGLLSLIQKDDGSPEASGEGAFLDGILEFAKNNPEAVQQFLGNVKGSGQIEDQTLFSN